MGYSQPIQPILNFIAIVLVGLFAASWYRRLKDELKEMRKTLGSLERRLDIVSCRYRGTRSTDEDEEARRNVA
jgi:hypothetical protein